MAKQNSTIPKWPAHLVPTEIERNTVAAVLLDEEAFYVVSNLLSLSDILDMRANRVYEAIVWLKKIGKKADLISVATRLSAKYPEEQHSVYLSEWVTEIVTAANVEQWALKIAECSRARMFITSLRSAAEHILKDTEPFPQALGKIQQAVYESQDRKESRKHQDSMTVAKDTLQWIDNIKTRGTSGSLVRSYLSDVDGIIQEFAPGEIIVVAGRPQHGKSALIAQSIYEMAEHGIKCAIVTMEMMNKELMMRRCVQKTHIPLHVIRGTHKLSPAQYSLVANTMGELSELPIYYDDNSYSNIADLEAKMEYLVIRHGVQVIMIDYIQLIRNPKADNREQDLANTSAALKNFAKRHQIPIIVIAQLNRELEKRVDRRPILSDLRESGAIEQDADKVLFIHRPAAYRDNKGSTFNVGGAVVDIAGHAEIIIAKNRNGACGNVLIGFKQLIGLFHDVDSPSEESF